MNQPLSPALITEQLAICDAWEASNVYANLAFDSAARAHYRAALEMAARAAAVENEAVEMGAILEWIEAALKGEPVSDFAESFPIVRKIVEQTALLNDLEGLVEENARLREALRFYGEQSNYSNLPSPSKMEIDQGEHARKALGE